MGDPIKELKAKISHLVDEKSINTKFQMIKAFIVNGCAPEHKAQVTHCLLYLSNF